MRIDQIRPENLVSLAEVAYKKDVDFYRSRKESFIRRLCPACGLESKSTFFVKDEFAYSRCKGCNCIFMNPGPTQELVDQFYSQSENYKFWSENTYPKSKEERIKTIHKERATWVLNQLYKEFPNQDSFTILELGAGTGDTLITLKKSSERDLHVYATEPNPSMASHLHANGISLVGSKELLTDKFAEKFDAVVCFEVLEHLLDPVDVILKIQRSLKSNGLIFASTPNSQSLEVLLLQGESTTVDIEHISILAPSSIYAIAGKTNCKVLEITTPGKFDVELMEKASTHLALSKKDQFMSNQTIQDFIEFSGFSSHMKVVLVRD